MKHIFLIISMMSIFLSYSLQAMDEAPKQIPISLDTITAELIHALKHHTSFNLFSHIVHDLGLMSEDEARAIIQNVNDCYIEKHSNEQHTKEIFDSLYSKNHLFRYAIQCLQKYAHNNLLMLTGETITTIENPSLDQPCPELNALPPCIKKYLMERTLDDYNDTSTIVLKKSYKSIVAFDICEVTHQAATYDDGNSFCLWNLKTAQKIDSQKPKLSIKQIAFNNDGSLLAVRSNKRVTIWEPTNTTLTLRYELQLNPEKLPLCYMQYAQSTSAHILSIFHSNIDTEGASTWIINRNKNNYMCFQKNIKPTDSQPLYIEKGIYSAHDPSYQHNQSTLYVTKKNCHALLLCKLAARQTKKTEDISKIFLAASYKPLTPCEGDEIHKELKKNPCFNKNTQPATLIEKVKKEEK